MKRTIYDSILTMLATQHSFSLQHCLQASGTSCWTTSDEQGHPATTLGESNHVGSVDYPAIR